MLPVIKPKSSVADKISRSGFGFGAGLGVVPTTIIQFHGEDWLGAGVMGGTYIGPTVTVTGAIGAAMADVLINNKLRIINNTLGTKLTWDAQVNAGADNYVCFSVSNVSAISTYLLVDFRNAGIPSYNLILETGNGGGYAFNGYLYGIAANLGSFVDLTPNENNSNYQIRCWIFEGGTGNLYVGGGASIYNDLWEPTQLGGAGYNKDWFSTLFGGTSQQLAHLSIHKFNSADTVKRSWVNSYANTLAVFYNLTWTNI